MNACITEGIQPVGLGRSKFCVTASIASVTVSVPVPDDDSDGAIKRIATMRAQNIAQDWAARGVCADTHHVMRL